MNTASITFRTDSETATDLGTLADATDRSKSWHVEQALKQYLATQAWQVSHISQGLQDVSRGDTVSHDAIADWLNSWGSESETAGPE